MNPVITEDVKNEKLNLTAGVTREHVLEQDAAVNTPHEGTKEPTFWFLKGHTAHFKESDKSPSQSCTCG